ncbi:MAG: L,D-transpeptidase family protein [Sphingorhabdus sp.]
MRFSIYSLPLLFAVIGCGNDSRTEQTPKTLNKPTAANQTESMDPLAARDPEPGEAVAPDADDIPRPVMQLQVVLDRLGFTPGVVDGKNGLSTRNAIAGFQEAQGLKITGELDEATSTALAQWRNIPATRLVTIPDAFARGPFVEMPEDAADQAKMQGLGYESLDEKLAERFHTTVETLQMLNTQSGSGVDASASRQNRDTEKQKNIFQAGQRIRVPNIGNDRVDAAQVDDTGWRDTLVMLGVASAQPKAERIIVSKSKGTLKAYDAQDKLVGMYTASMGSPRDPLPLGRWKVNGVARNPEFHYNPELFWDVSDSKDDQMLPPGPNSPVGIVWIDLSKEHYGIHGTPEPQTIGRAQSHGCVRLTNWDAARLAQMVSPGVQVLFEA